MAYFATRLPLNTALLFVIPLLVFVVTLIRGLRMTAPGRAKIKNNFCGTCQLKIELDGLAEVRSSGELKRNWSAIDRIVTTPTHLFIYATGLIAFIVPRRAFFDEADFKRFVKAIEDRAPVPNAVKHFCS
ncbi:MAG: YcxB family protein [Pirellulaceae bacterium]|nr:YcxB family protein [Pirellulaceae bacterium]